LVALDHRRGCGFSCVYLKLH